MIYWNAVLYGYSASISSPNQITNLSQLTKLKDCIWSIPEISIDSYEGKESDSLDYPNTSYYVEKWLGDQSAGLYSFPFINATSYPSDSGMMSALEYQQPSISKNLGDVFSAEVINNYVTYILYVPTLKRAFTVSGIVKLWSVDDGNMSPLSSSGVFHLDFYAGYSSYYREQYYFQSWVLVTPYIDNSTLLTVANFRYLLSRYSSRDHNTFQFFNLDQITAGTLKNLFGDNVPDGQIIPPITPSNPYEPGGESGPGGGNGTFDNDSDQIEMPPLPTLSSANTGFTRIYNPTLSQVQALANYLWTDETVIETIWNHIKQYFENPMEAIIGFNLVPVPVPDGGTENFKLMYIDTGVSMTVAASQFVEVDCGTLEVPLYYGSALDYSPYTKISIFLPYIGMVSVNTDEVMGRTMKVTYRVDICSGSCVASIFVDDNPLYQYSGHCAIPIPISAADFSTYVSSAISVGKLTGAAMLAGAGIVAPPPPITASQHTNQTTTTTTTDTARNPSTGRQITTGSQTVVQSTESSSEQSSTKASYNGLTPQSVSNTVGDVISSKPHVEHSGSFSGNSGYLGVRRPYMILQRPRMCMPGNYQQFNGFPCMMSLNLGECSGFTRVQQVHLTGLWATNPEQAEILELLKMGVVL